MSDFELESFGPELTRIALAPVAELVEGSDEVANIYLVKGSSPSLINAGHPSQAEALASALRAIDISPSQIERIVCTSWDPGVLGGAAHFPRADLFVLSPDMQSPRDLELQIDRRRRILRKLADEIAAVEPDFRRLPVEQALGRYYPRMTRNLRFIPLREGHQLRVGSFCFEVLATPGPGMGHMSLWEPEQRYLFSGDFALRGFPRYIDDMPAYLTNIERLASLDSERVFPNRGRTYTRGRLTLTQAARFLNHFMISATTALVQGPTILEFIERDRGHFFEDPMELLLHFQVNQALLEELAKSRYIGTEGEGAARRYGTDIEDPRGEVRRF